MKAISVSEMMDSELQELANLVKEALLKGLEIEGLLLNSETICSEYAVLITRKGWLGRIIDRVWGASEDGIQIRIVKLVGKSAPSPAPADNEETK